MSRDIHAIYANGVLRPLDPLDLPEGTRVHLRVEEEENNASSASIALAELAQQQKALEKMFRDVDRIPQTPRNDGLSGRNHDQILYGSPK